MEHRDVKSQRDSDAPAASKTGTRRVDLSDHCSVQKSNRSFTMVLYTVLLVSRVFLDANAVCHDQLLCATLCILSRAIHYCSRACQRQHWITEHKDACAYMAARRAEEISLPMVHTTEGYHPGFGSSTYVALFILGRRGFASCHGIVIGLSSNLSNLYRHDDPATGSR